MVKKTQEYIKKWKKQGYPIGIPDEVPGVLMRENLAPSYMAIAIAILKNDHNFICLGFNAKKSFYYNVLKKIELKKRGTMKEDLQLYFF